MSNNCFPLLIHRLKDGSITVKIDYIDWNIHTDPSATLGDKIMKILNLERGQIIRIDKHTKEGMQIARAIVDSANVIYQHYVHELDTEGDRGAQAERIKGRE